MRLLPRFAALSVLAAATAHAGDFVDTRISLVLADDNVLARAGESKCSSPDVGLGVAGCNNTQFYDNFNTKFSGFESLSNIALYKKTASYFDGFTGEAALTINVLAKLDGSIAFADNSSYVKLNYRPGGWGEKEEISFTGFPVSSDRFRLGYAYRISWAGSSVFTDRAYKNGVPGARLQLTRDRWYLFAGLKTGLLSNDKSLEKERVYGGMGGGGIDILETLRFEANGGYFQKGIAPGQANQGIIAPINARGVSAQLTWHVGVPVGTSIDFKLYKNDPDIFQKFFTPEQYPGGLAYSVSIEGAYLDQTLVNPDVFAATKLQAATAVALQARAKFNFLRVNLLALYRTPSYILFDVPGFPPYNDFPTGTQQKPEMFVALGADYHLPGLHLTPGVIVGVQQPASIKSPRTVLGGNNPPGNLIGQRTAVITSVSDIETLPTNYEALPVISAKVNAKLDLSDYMSFIAEVYYTRNANRTTFQDDVAGIAEPSFEKPDGVGFNVIMQARF